MNGKTPEKTSNAEANIEPLLSIEEVAELLKLKKSTIYSMSSRGAIPCVKISPKILRFKASDIRQLIENSYVRGTSEASTRNRSTRNSSSRVNDNGYLEEIIDSSIKELMT